MKATLPRGFTLVEVLVTVAITGLLFGVLSNSIVLASRTTIAIESTISQSRSNAFGADYLRRQLLAVRPVVESTTRSQSYFEGGSASLRFVSPLAFDAAADGLYSIQLFVVSGAESSVLRMRFQPFEAPGSSPQSLRDGTHDIDLLRMPGKLTLSYQSFTGSNARIWENSWDRSRGRLPSLLKIAGDGNQLELILALGAISTI